MVLPHMVLPYMVLPHMVLLHILTRVSLTRRPVLASKHGHAQAMRELFQGGASEYVIGRSGDNAFNLARGDT